MDGRDGCDGVTLRFEASRVRLRAVAYRMLGSAGEADAAVQEACLQSSGSRVEILCGLRMREQVSV
jgi:RNA polymerase sigma-70 factor (ECF subfamily)